MLFEKVSGIPAACGPFPPGPGGRGRLAESRLPAVLTPALARGLDQSAATFLAGHGITSEPLNWDPPAELLDDLSLPGIDPATIDTAQLHQLIRRDHLSTAAAARRLGATRAAVELLLDHDPAPAAVPSRPAARPPRTVPSREEFTAWYCDENLSLAKIARRTGMSAGCTSRLARDYEIPVRGQKDYDVHQHPVLTRDWLHDQYVISARSLRSIAVEAAMSTSAVRHWVKIYRLPAQARFPIRMDIAAAAAAAPPILRPAITGPGAWKRLSRLAAASSYPSLREAAASLGIGHTVLITQVNRLERELGHRLLDRAPGQHAMQPTAYGRNVIAAIRAANVAGRADDIRPRRLKKMPPD
jgi:Bacterial regulatory helix-turn-helix protein, lysR family